MGTRVSRGAEPLLDELADLGLPVVCAGGIGSPDEFVAALRMGYAAVQLGTRFIATTECRAHERYKQAILDAGESDIVLTERLTGIPVSVIDTPYIRRIGTTRRLARATTAARAAHQALHADRLRAAVALAAQARPVARRRQRRLLAGR